jgi:hypothetical protein
MESSNPREVTEYMSDNVFHALSKQKVCRPFFAEHAVTDTYGHGRIAHAYFGRRES